MACVSAGVIGFSHGQIFGTSVGGLIGVPRGRWSWCHQLDLTQATSGRTDRTAALVTRRSPAGKQSYEHLESLTDDKYKRLTILKQVPCGSRPPYCRLTEPTTCQTGNGRSYVNEGMTIVENRAGMTSGLLVSFSLIRPDRKGYDYFS